MLTVCDILDDLFVKDNNINTINSSSSSSGNRGGTRQESERAQPSDQFSILIYSRMHVFRKLKASGQANYSRRSKDFVKKHGDDDGGTGDHGTGGVLLDPSNELDEDVAGK